MRLFSLAAIALLAGCSSLSGMGFTPGGAPAAPAGLARSLTRAAFSVTIPKAHRHRGPHPNTISPLTESFSVVVNGSKAQIFDATPSSPDCTTGSSGLTCRFVVKGVPYGSDTFVVGTYSATGGGGYLLDQAKATIPVTRATKSIAFTLGPVVSNANDSGPGSLREAVLDAHPGDTILFALKLPATISFGSPIALHAPIAISGPGASELTFDGKGATQLFDVLPGVAVTLSGMTMTHGYSSTESGGAIFNQGTLTIDSAAFFGNSVLGRTSGGSGIRPEERFHPDRWVRRDGHRVRVRGSRGVSRRPHYSYAVGNGGAIYDDSCSCTDSLTITNSTFQGNAALSGGYDGGAIYNGAGVKLKVSGSTFTSNTASYGGAIESDGPASYDHDTFTTNSAKPSAATYVYGSGGAMHADNVTSIADCTFTGNTADGDDASDRRGFGGAISSSGYGALLTITGSSFSNNVAGGTSAVDAQAYGGAIWVNYATSGNLTLDGDTFTGNVAETVVSYAEGGAIDAADVYTGTSYPVVGKNDAFSKNAAMTTGSNAYAQGGAISGDGVALSNSSFTSNAATSSQGSAESGAVDADYGVTLTNVTFANNSASGTSSAYAGAMYLYGSAYDDTLDGVAFTGNAVQTAGGEVEAEAGALYAGSPTTIVNGTFTGNRAFVPAGVAYGGAILVAYPMTFRGGTVSNNSASTSGGGFYAEDSLAIDNATISGNNVTGAYAVDGGGGIYAAGGMLAVTASTISGNGVVGQANSGGGGIYSAGAASISNSTIAGNTSSVDGGGFENKSTYGSYAGPSFVNVTIYGNTAGGSGGNVKNFGSQAAMSLQNSIVSHGTAPVGSDISNDGTIASADYNIVNPLNVAGNALGGTTTHDVAFDPQLLPLANNGGPTQTLADQLVSPGYNYIPLANCTGAKPSITKDQRGDPRGDNADGKCDVGAYELQSATPLR